MHTNTAMKEFCPMYATWSTHTYCSFFNLKTCIFTRMKNISSCSWLCSSTGLCKCCCCCICSWLFTCCIPCFCSRLCCSCCCCFSSGLYTCTHGRFCAMEKIGILYSLILISLLTEYSPRRIIMIPFYDKHLLPNNCIIFSIIITNLVSFRLTSNPWLHFHEWTEMDYDYSQI